MDGRIAIGKVYGEHEEITSAFSEFGGRTPETVNVFGLAGPNDLVQILADAEGWQIIVGTIVSVIGTGFLSEAGKDAWRASAPVLRSAPSAAKTAFLKLVESMHREKQNHQDVCLGFIEPTFDFHQRADRLYIDDFDADEIARKMVVFGNAAPNVVPWLLEEKKVSTDQHRRLHVEVTDAGTLIVSLDSERRIYGPTGERLS